MTLDIDDLVRSGGFDAELFWITDREEAVLEWSLTLRGKITTVDISITPTPFGEAVREPHRPQATAMALITRSPFEIHCTEVTPSDFAAAAGELLVAGFIVRRVEHALASSDYRDVIRDLETKYGETAETKTGVLHAQP